ncbi:MAG: DUF805 domain-containing protein [Rhizobiaceae bacterium]|nr:DUF805 domain-containing protein [Rhizobiaceae bacterium]
MSKIEPTLSWLFFSFRGRIARQSFILGILFLVFPQLFAVIQMVRADNAGKPDQIAFWFLVLIVFLLVSFWSSLALSVKRLHDLSLPGALSILAIFSGINLVFFLYLAVMPSKQEINEYGPPPFS